MSEVSRRRLLRNEPPWLRLSLIGVAVALTFVFIFLPLAAVFIQAFDKGWAVWRAAVTEENARKAILLSLLVTGIAVPLNLIFGLAAAWSIARFRFRGRNVLVTLIDIPFGVSPVVAGLIFVLVFGAQGWLGPWLSDHDIQIIFAVPGIVLATVFVTFPFVARELMSFDAVAGFRRRGGRDRAGRYGLADVSPRDATQYQVGLALRRGALHGARAG